jgi:hypothetical protein
MIQGGAAAAHDFKSQQYELHPHHVSSPMMVQSG